MSTIKRILIINGPNLNLLGTRETDIYGSSTWNDIFSRLKTQYPELEFMDFQSNIEGEIIDQIQLSVKDFDAVIINPAGYSHTSVSIADAIAAVNISMIEVHLSNIHAREDFRQTTLTGRNCRGVISGFGDAVYRLAVEALLEPTY